jgi:hypothetical protein
MNQGRMTVWIGEREALPVRAIPYVTSWQVSPDGIARVLARPPVITIGTNLQIHNKHSLIAYLMGAHGSFDPLPASQWKDCAITLNSLTQKLKADERDDATHENHGPWRVAAILALPDNVFVWMDEFQSWYSATRPMLHRDGDSARMGALIAERERTDSDTQKLDDLEAEIFQTADDRLCLTPILPAEIEGKVWRYAEVVVPVVVAKAIPPELTQDGDMKLADTSAQPLTDQGDRIDSTIVASVESGLVGQNAECSVAEPFLAQGPNARAAVEKWVKWHALRMAADFSKMADIAENIQKLAESHGYKSERREISVASITKMIPAGSTGGRGKNKGRSRNMGSLAFGKSESK